MDGEPAGRRISSRVVEQEGVQCRDFSKYPLMVVAGMSRWIVMARYGGVK
jgi:hypothetical protein